MSLNPLLGAAFPILLLWCVLVLCLIAPETSRPSASLGAIATLSSLSFLLWAVVVPRRWQVRTFAGLRRLLWIYGTGAAALAAVAWMELDRSGSPPAAIALGWVTSLLTFAVLSLSPSGPEPALLATYQRWLLVWSCILLGGTILMALLQIPLVIRQAKAVADARPYCIQIPSTTGGFRYTPVTLLWDLTALRMRSVPGEDTRARRHQHSTFHAVLFVERRPRSGMGPGVRANFERLNWSYRHQGFRPIEGQGHFGFGEDPDCVPSTNFAGELSLF